MNMQDNSSGSRQIPVDFREMDKNDFSIINAKKDRKLFINALENGTLACLPGESGFADTHGACNVVNRTLYRGSSQFLLKDFQIRNGFPTAEYLTYDQIEKAAAFSGDRISVAKGQHGFTLNFLVDGEQKSVRLFNIAQTTKPELIRSYADHLAVNREQYLKQQYGENYRPKMNTPGPSIACSSPDPSTYMGEYLAALSMGRQFQATPQQADEFKQKTKDFIFERNQEGHINPFNLNRLGNLASKCCRQIIPEIAQAATPEIKSRPPKKVAEPSMER
jgi:hypothetical protein